MVPDIKAYYKVTVIRQCGIDTRFGTKALLQFWRGV